MKTASLLMVLIFCFMIMMAGCGNTKIIDGYEYDTYGLINRSEKRNPDIRYELIVGNVVWSVILVETIIAPIYFLGFSLYEPVGVDDGSVPKGAIN